MIKKLRWYWIERTRWRNFIFAILIISSLSPLVSFFLSFLFYFANFCYIEKFFLRGKTCSLGLAYRRAEIQSLGTSRIVRKIFCRVNPSFGWDLKFQLLELENDVQILHLLICLGYKMVMSCTEVQSSVEGICNYFNSKYTF